jgi:hypothetical protein
MLEIQHKQEIFVELVNKYINEDERENYLNSYKKLQNVTTFFKENYNLNEDEVDLIATSFTQNYSKSKETEIAIGFKEDPFGTLANIYQEFLNYKNYPEDISQDLKLVLEFLIQHEKNI